MSDDQWARSLFGADGPVLRGLLPQMIFVAHNQMATSQTASGLRSHEAYGGMWKRVHQEFATELPPRFPGRAKTIKPKGAGYEIVKFQGVPLFPWRYARDVRHEPTTVRLGNPPSDARKSIMAGAIFDDQMSIFEDGYFETDEERADVDMTATEGIVQDLYREYCKVVIIPYASNPSGLLRLHWGTGQLNLDGTIAFEHLEDLPFPGDGGGFGYGEQAQAVGGQPGLKRPPALPGGSFADAPLEEPNISLQDEDDR